MIKLCCDFTLLHFIPEGEKLPVPLGCVLASCSCHPQVKGLEPNDLSGIFQPKTSFSFNFFHVKSAIFCPLFPGSPRPEVPSVSLQHLSVNLEGFALVSGVIL